MNPEWFFFGTRPTFGQCLKRPNDASNGNLGYPPMVSLWEESFTRILLISLSWPLTLIRMVHSPWYVDVHSLVFLQSWAKKEMMKQHPLPKIAPNILVKLFEFTMHILGARILLPSPRVPTPKEHWRQTRNHLCRDGGLLLLAQQHLRLCLQLPTLPSSMWDNRLIRLKELRSGVRSLILIGWAEAKQRGICARCQDQHEWPWRALRQHDRCHFRSLWSSG